MTDCRFYYGNLYWKKSVRLGSRDPVVPPLNAGIVCYLFRGYLPILPGYFLMHLLCTEGMKVSQGFKQLNLVRTKVPMLHPLHVYIMQNTDHTSISLYQVISVHSDHPEVQVHIDDFLPLFACFWPIRFLVYVMGLGCSACWFSSWLHSVGWRMSWRLGYRSEVYSEVSVGELAGRLRV